MTKVQTPPSPVGKTYDQWISDIMPKITEAQKMIEDALSKDASVAMDQATLTEDKYREVNDILAEANAWLDWHEYVENMKQNRDRGSVSERAIELKVKVAPQRMLRDKIKGLSDSLKSRMRRAQWQA